MILGMPVMDGHEWTQKTVQSLARTVRGDDFYLVIIDNNSEEPYRRGEFDVPFGLSVFRATFNAGYYEPLSTLYETTKDDLIGLIHNDLIFYEQGWNRRMEDCFAADPLLGLVGLVGSYQADDSGGRGAGTMCWFNGSQGQSQAAGERISDLRPSILLDSLFMLFRREVVPLLEMERDRPTLAHFYDKIWPCRLIENGWRVGTLGVEIDHWGGITLVANQRFETDCERWCRDNGVQPLPIATYGDGRVNWGLMMYLEGERRYLDEFRTRKGFIPCSIDRNWVIGGRGPYILRRPTG